MTPVVDDLDGEAQVDEVAEGGDAVARLEGVDVGFGADQVGGLGFFEVEHELVLGGLAVGGDGFHLGVDDGVGEGVDAVVGQVPGLEEAGREGAVDGVGGVELAGVGVGIGGHGGILSNGEW